MRSVLVSTNEPIVEVGLKALLSGDQDFTLLHVCHTDAETEAWARTHQPDLILYGLPIDPHMSAIRQLRSTAEKCSIVFWRREISAELAQQLVALGVKGFLDASASLDSIRDCLRLASGGQIWMERTLTTRLLNLRSIELSPRQSQLIGLLVQGLKNKEIAISMGISEATVKAYLTTVFEKVGVKDRLELALFGLKHLRNPSASDAEDSGRPTRKRPRLAGQRMAGRIA